MKLIKSKQKNVKFLFCPNPFTIDKSLEWGPGNLQIAMECGFVKLQDEFTISHLVQANKSKTCPIGWVKSEQKGFFNKKPIFVDDSKILQPNEIVHLDTLDGKMKYVIDKESVVVYNSNDEGEIDQQDCWIITLEDLIKNYEY